MLCSTRWSSAAFRQTCGPVNQVFLSSRARHRGTWPPVGRMQQWGAAWGARFGINKVSSNSSPLFSPDNGQVPKPQHRGGAQERQSRQAVSSISSTSPNRSDLLLKHHQKTEHSRPFQHRVRDCRYPGRRYRTPQHGECGQSSGCA